MDGQRSVAVESSLERDFVLLCRFEPDFAGIEEQPVMIPVPGGRRYTPDFLVTWREPRPPDLVEVKYQADLATQADILRPKFAAAEAYGRDRGWQFQVATDKDTHRKEVFDIADLKADSDPAEAPPPAIDSLDEDDLAEAKRRLEVIKPLLSIGRGRTKAIDAIATEYGLGRRTIERWLHNYEARELLSDLAPQRRKRPMPTRLHPEVEALVAKVIEDFYLTKQNLSPRKAYETLKRLCAGIRRKPPHEETFRRRLDAVPEELKLRRRKGRKAARDRFAEVKGAFPGADFPLAVVQIDHTRLDIDLVDDDTRQPIGRPNLTLAIDVYSRMVTGFYLSLDPPNAFSVGMCIARSALDKDAHLDRLGIKGRWPVWGLPRRIHADNGKEFHSKTLDKACQQYGIAITWRPVKVSAYGFGASALDVGERLIDGLESPTTISAVRAGNPPPLTALLNHPNLFLWGDLDIAGFQIFMRARARLPALRLSAIYFPMLAHLKAGGGHPYVSLTGKAGQDRGFTSSDPIIAPLLDRCRSRAIDQEWVRAEDIRTNSLSPLGTPV
ncbi:MAG: DDE-type integrase/transposase/recombinase [Phaeospirillum sp.]|nr:DDE-type integrase/transposase/recombinase [Phaeospirillum sp.]